ncbi:DUF4214 domain-containing protein [Massilia sp. IC2-476]|uniref:DUF4214 domain-containing protein n=1 Tax=Massilia sp. IC2-476 TaxID=2887199 RepID=UPI0027D95493|nr:DUF4214 domain-containing protein [Massilia sp. IC2-476]
MALAGIERSGSAGNDDMVGTSGDDKLYGAGGSDILMGLNGDDKLYSSLLRDPATGAWRPDDKGDILDGGKGNDLLQGGVANDMLLGGDGNDTLYGAGGRDSLQGGAGDDILQSGRPWDPATEEFSPDLLGDTLDGGDGNDTIYGDDGADVLMGGAGNDGMSGGGGNDLLLGGSGNDTLVGGAGNDTLDGGAGISRLAGGLGDDVYSVRSALDQVWDEGGNDRGTIYADWVLPVGSVENWTWAAGVQKLPHWIAALAVQVPAARLLGAARIIDYHFAEQPAAFFEEHDKKGFETFNEAQRALTRKAFEYISSVANVQFRETDALDGEGVLILANNQQENSSGYASNRLVMLNAGLREVMAPTSGNFGAAVLMHEIGHALGLKHPFAHEDSVGNSGDGPFLSSVEDAAHHTLMSYNVTPSDYQLSYNALDLAALHYIYGPTGQVASGDTTWTLDADQANFIADGAGSDTLDGSAFGGGMTLDLRPGYWSFLGAKGDSIVRAGQVTVNFGSLIENLRGGAGNDRLTGNEVGNRIEGGAGHDILVGGAGSDRLDGGAGIDVAAYAGKRAGYKLTIGKDGVTVADSLLPDVDVLVGIERLAFDDVMVALDTDGIAAQTYRLYQAAFNREPDLAGLGYWIGRMESGSSLKDVAANFIASSEFTGMYGLKPSHADFLTRIYQNILHRAPDPAGFDYWLQVMERGASATEILAQFSQSPENVAALAGVLEGGIAYLPFG